MLARIASLALLLVLSISAFAQQADKDTEALLEMFFGRNGVEMKHAGRLRLPQFGMVAAFSESRILGDGRVELRGPVSIGLSRMKPNGKGAAEMHVFRGDKATIQTVPWVKQVAELPTMHVFSVALHNERSIVRLVAIPELPPFSSGPPVAILPPSGLPPGTSKEESKELPQKPVDIRFSFSLDAKTPLSELLPRATKSAPLPAPFNDDLTKVPEIAFGEPISKKLTKIQAVEETSHQLAKANHLNRPKADGFMEALIANRADLHGLPFLMGDECRTREEQARLFATMADLMNRLTSAVRGDATEQVPAEFVLADAGTKALMSFRMMPRVSRDKVDRAAVAAAMQIFMPESEAMRVGLARYLASIPHVDATKALARLVLFSAEESVRNAAIDGLKVRREQDYTAILLEGFRYPLPAVSKRAADALVRLERKDVLPQLVDVLDRADPRLPVREKDELVVREVVKINHHRNCMLCHAPGNTDSVPEGILKIAVPLPTEPLPKPSEGGGYQSTPPATPDIVVRIDMTYLRQDFSLMLPVADAAPWPELQRFDFLVRRRVVSAQEASAYVLPSGPGQLSPYHRAALFALRELSGRDAEPTPAAWRKLLKLPHG